ncbi:MAG: M24 family metallopeptidase, partial [Gemmatimonadota bacterium]
MGASLSASFVERARDELRAAGVDGWLLYDFRGRNPMAADLLGMPEGQKRRYFVFLPAEGPPVALVHRIELSGWDGWDGRIESYVGWEEMEETLGRIVGGQSTVAMEVSPRDAVPYVDNVPAGVVELVRSLGIRIVSSVDLISTTAAQWGDRGRALHREAAEILARTARAAFERARSAMSGDGATEHDVAEWVRGTLREAGLADADTIVAVGENAAKPHYEPPAEGSAAIRPGEVLLVDLWGRHDEASAVFADQTW